MVSRRDFLGVLGAVFLGFLFPRLGLAEAAPVRKACGRLSSVPALLFYMVAEDIGVPVREGGVDALTAIVVTGRREVDGRGLFSTRDAVALGLKGVGEVKAAAYDVAFLGEKARLEIAAAAVSGDAVAASYRLTYSRGVITAVAIYKIRSNTVYLDKLAVNGKPKILTSCANECQDDTDCAPPNPDCLNYCCAWNINCLINCCGAGNQWNPCYVPCHTSGTACLLCLLVICGLTCLQYICCTSTIRYALDTVGENKK